LDSDAFSYREIGGDRVQISRWGRVVVTLAGKDAVKFLSRVESADKDAAQLLMAKATGKFKFGNERIAKQKGKGH